MNSRARPHLPLLVRYTILCSIGCVLAIFLGLVLANAWMFQSRPAQEAMDPAEQSARVLVQLASKISLEELSQILRDSKTDFSIVAASSPMSLRSNQPLLSRRIPIPGHPEVLLQIPPNFDEMHRTRSLPPLLFSLMLTVLVTILSSLGALIWLLRSYAKQARGVMAKLTEGELETRFPIVKIDEFGQLMGAFNAMADHIQALIERIRKAERQRIELLQDLGHDLRTPIASLRVMLSVLSKKKSEGLPLETLQMMIDNCQSETAYIGRLVDDLLFLALMEDPQSLQGRTPCSFTEALRKVVLQVQAKSDRKIEVHSTIPEDTRIIVFPFLLERLFRNALENAQSFARNKVEVSVGMSAEGSILFRVKDDGPGFPSEILQNYGTKRVTRIVEEGVERRPSLGLGSVIIRKASAVHGGHLRVYNCEDESKKVLGGVLEIVFPQHI